MSTDYINGSSQMILNSRQIPPWDDAESTLNAMNLAFKIYYLGLKAGIESDGQAIWDSVKDSGTDGDSSWFGNHIRGEKVPDDLIQALRYLTKRAPFPPMGFHGQTWWGIKQRQTYSGDMLENSVGVPRSIFNFLSSVEAKMKTVGGTLKSLNQSMAIARQQQQNGDWEALGRTLNTINSKANKTKHLLWLTPSNWQSKAKFSMSLMSTTNDIHKFATLLVDKGAERAILETIAVKALGKLPILGQFYVAAIESIPAIHRAFSGAINCHAMMATAAGNGLDFRNSCRQNNRFY